MDMKLFIFWMMLVCALALVTGESDFGRDDMWEYLKGVENEADYDNYVKDLDSRTPEKYGLFRREEPLKYKTLVGRQNRAAYPQRDFEGNCPPGFRTDRLGMCREIW